MGHPGGEDTASEALIPRAKRSTAIKQVKTVLWVVAFFVYTACCWFQFALQFFATSWVFTKAQQQQHEQQQKRTRVARAVVFAISIIIVVFVIFYCCCCRCASLLLFAFVTAAWRTAIQQPVCSCYCCHCCCCTVNHKTIPVKRLYALHIRWLHATRRCYNNNNKM